MKNTVHIFGSFLVPVLLVLCASVHADIVTFRNNWKAKKRPVARHYRIRRGHLSSSDEKNERPQEKKLAALGERRQLVQKPRNINRRMGNQYNGDTDDELFLMEAANLADGSYVQHQDGSVEENLTPDFNSADQAGTDVPTSGSLTVTPSLMPSIVMTETMMPMTAVHPVNDQCPGAIRLVFGDVISGTTQVATQDLAYPLCENDNNESVTFGVWYRFRAGENLVEISLQGNVGMIVFQGPNCNNLICLQKTEVTSFTYNTFTPVPGERHYILVYTSVGDQPSDFELSLNEIMEPNPAPTPAGGGEILPSFIPASSGAPTEAIITTNPSSATSVVPTQTIERPSNDICSDNIRLKLGDTISGSTTSATIDKVELCGATQNNGPSVWYSVTGTGDAILASFHGDFYIQTSIFEGASCDSLVCIDGTNGAADNQSGSVAWLSQRFLTYYIMVHGDTNSTADAGDFELRIESLLPIGSSAPNVGRSEARPKQKEGEYSVMIESPPNNVCPGAVRIDYNRSASGSTEKATSNLGYPSCSEGIDHKYGVSFQGLWYRFRPTNGDPTIVHVEESFGSRITVFAGPNCNNLQCVLRQNSTAGPVTFIWNLPQGKRYYILVESQANDTGTFDLNLLRSLPSPEGDIASMHEIGDYTSNSTLVDTAVPSGETTGVNVLLNQECPGSFHLRFGETITGTTVLSSEHLNFVVCSKGEMDTSTYQGVWYRFRTPSGYPIKAVLQSNINIRLTVFVGPDCNNLHCILYEEVTDPRRALFVWNLQQGERHYILIQAMANQEGSFNFTISEDASDELTFQETQNPTSSPTFFYTFSDFGVTSAPTEETTLSASLGISTMTPTEEAVQNDECRSAVRLVFGRTISGSSDRALPDIGYPSCGDEASMATRDGVWYRFRPLNGVPIQVDVRTDGNMTLTVFVGPNCNNLVCVGESYGGLSMDPLVLNLESGKRHYILIDGTNENKSFNLTIKEVFNYVSSTGAPSASVTRETGSPSILETSDETSLLLPEGSEDEYSGEMPVEIKMMTFGTNELLPKSRSAPPSSGTDIPIDTVVLTENKKGNDSCSNSTKVSSGELIRGSTRQATLDNNIEYCGLVERNSAPGRWFKWYSSGTRIRASIFATYKAQLSIYTGINCDKLSCVDGMKVGRNGFKIGNIELDTVLGFSYYFLVHGVNGEVGGFLFEVDEIEAGATAKAINDKCSEAITLEIDDTVSGSTMDAETDKVTLCNLDSPTGPGVWYRFLGTGKLVRLSFIASFDAQVTVFVGQSCQSIECIATTEEQSSRSMSGAVVFKPVERNNYFILIHSLSQEVGDFELSIGDMVDIVPTSLPSVAMSTWSPTQTVETQQAEEASTGPTPMIGLPTVMTAAPTTIRETELPTGPSALSQTVANDLCSTAISISVGETLQGNTTFAGASDVAQCGSALPFDAHGVFYVVMGTGTSLQVTVQASYQAQITLYTGECSGLACLDGTEGTPPLYTYGSIVWDSVEGQRYIIYVHGFVLQAGAFEISVQETVRPSNDNCDAAKTVKIGSKIKGTTTLASSDMVDNYCGANANSAPGIWYTFNGDTRVVQVMFNATYDAQMSVYSSYSCEQLSCVAGTEGRPPLFTSGDVVIETQEDQKYYILIHGFSYQTGIFDMEVSEVVRPPNDECPGAIEIPIGSTLSGNTAFASAANNVNECGTAVRSGAPGVWFQSTGTGSFFQASLVSDYDAQLSIFSSRYCSLSCITGTSGSPPDFSSPKVSWRSVQGETYAILVDGARLESGNFNLTLSDLSTMTNPPTPAPVAGGSGEFLTQTPSSLTGFPPNDRCLNAKRLQRYDSVVGSTAKASIDNVTSCTSDPINAPGVWFVVQGSGRDLQASISSNYLSRIAIYSGPLCDHLTCVTEGQGAGSNTSQWPTQEETPYYIMVNGDQSVGDFELMLSETGPPSNPSTEPSSNPSTPPTGSPSESPTDIRSPSILPTVHSTDTGTRSPTSSISTNLSDKPTHFPTTAPTRGSPSESGGSGENLAGGPRNDSCEASISLTRGLPVVGSTNSATMDTSVLQCLDANVAAGHGVWYTFEGIGQSVQIIFTADFDSVISLFVGESCSSLNCTTGFAVFPSTNTATLLETTDGRIYHLLVHGRIATETGTFNLVIRTGGTAAPSSGPSMLLTSGQTTAPSLPPTESQYPSGLPSFVPTDTPQLTLYPSDLKSIIPTKAPTSSPSNKPTILDVPSGSPTSSRSLQPTVSVTYSSNGTVESLPNAPENNECVGSISLTLGTLLLGESTVSASPDSVLLQCSDVGSLSSPGLWYSFLASTSTVEVVFTANFDAQIALFVGKTCEALVCTSGYAVLPSTNTATVLKITEGQTYYFLVHGSNGGTGNFNLYLRSTSTNTNPPVGPTGGFTAKPTLISATAGPSTAPTVAPTSIATTDIPSISPAVGTGAPSISFTTVPSTAPPTTLFPSTEALSSDQSMNTTISSPVVQDIFDNATLRPSELPPTALTTDPALTSSPTEPWTSAPSHTPSFILTDPASEAVSSRPTIAPSMSEVSAPTPVMGSSALTAKPTRRPTSFSPSVSPSTFPEVSAPTPVMGSSALTAKPTRRPTSFSPSVSPSTFPSPLPTENPSDTPTNSASPTSLIRTEPMFAATDGPASKETKTTGYDLVIIPETRSGPYRRLEKKSFIPLEHGRTVSGSLRSSDKQANSTHYCGLENFVGSPETSLYFIGGSKQITKVDFEADFRAEIRVYAAKKGTDACNNISMIRTALVTRHDHSNIVTTWQSSPEESYFVSVAGADGGVGNYNLTHRTVQSPPNDICTGALPKSMETPIHGWTYMALQKTIDDCSNPGMELATMGLWYRVHGTGSVHVASLSALYEGQISVYRGECDVLTCVDGTEALTIDEPYFSNSILERTFEWETKAEELYYILVHGATEEARGEFHLLVTVLH